jgi:hypothetical protein
MEKRDEDFRDVDRGAPVFVLPMRRPQAIDRD